MPRAKPTAAERRACIQRLRNAMLMYGISPALTAVWALRCYEARAANPGLLTAPERLPATISRALVESLSGLSLPSFTHYAQQVADRIAGYTTGSPPTEHPETDPLTRALAAVLLIRD